jgi:hypothetical protein
VNRCGQPSLALRVGILPAVETVFPAAFRDRIVPPAPAGILAGACLHFHSASPEHPLPVFLRGEYTMIRCLPLAVIVCLVCSVCAAADRPLLNVSEGQKPNDTAFENRTTLSIEPNADLGGKALKVVLA